MTAPFESFERAIARHDEVLHETQSMTQREASIHGFEFAFELTWNSIQGRLRRKGLDAATPRDCLEQAWRLARIDDEGTRLDLLRDGNPASHTYQEALAIEVYRRLPAHLGELRLLRKKLAVA